MLSNIFHQPCSKCYFEPNRKKLVENWHGLANNYRLANIEAMLKSIDEWLRNRQRNSAGSGSKIKMF